MQDGLTKYKALVPASTSDSQSSDNGTDIAVLSEMVEISFTKPAVSATVANLKGNYRKEGTVLLVLL